MLFCSHWADTLIHSDRRIRRLAQGRRAVTGIKLTSFQLQDGRTDVLCSHEDALTPQCDTDVFFKRADKNATWSFNLLWTLMQFWQFDFISCVVSFMKLFGFMKRDTFENVSSEQFYSFLTFILVQKQMITDFFRYPSYICIFYNTLVFRSFS